MALSNVTKEWAGDHKKGWYKNPWTGNWSKPNFEYTIQVYEGEYSLTLSLVDGTDDIRFVSFDKPIDDDRYNQELEELMELAESGKTKEDLEWFSHVG